jgi:hypothetical protein
LRFTLIAFLIWVLAWPATAAQSEHGSLCVHPVPQGHTYLSCRSGNLSLKIDARQSIPWPRKEGLKIEDLDLTQSHLVVAICDGKRVQSARFRFSSYKTAELCLAFQDMFDGYEGLWLTTAKDTPWCRHCK